MCVFFSTGVRVFVPLLSGHRIVVGEKEQCKGEAWVYFAGFAGPPTGSIGVDYAPCHFENEINSLCLQLSALAGQRGLANHYGKRGPVIGAWIRWAGCLSSHKRKEWWEPDYLANGKEKEKLSRSG